MGARRHALARGQALLSVANVVLVAVAVLRAQNIRSESLSPLLRFDHVIISAEKVFSQKLISWVNIVILLLSACVRSRA